ncbi:Ig-like domain-containing protein [Acidovorax sp. SUPP3434]|uniref:Ig-like domain-containing protein n=1 Tax=Acidovorax sp. SUPP3434 TaxID=2920880 RepID=UPI0023DE5832|nr:Ig-like domain-containing protein [Acidovorax sp. SUPP3434]GKS98885.1 Ig-like domain-containing protein [Acidovorax sp. SUPP3434]
MKSFIKIIALSLAATLVACGGGGGSAGTTPGGTTPVSTAASVEILTSATGLASADKTGLTLTAVVKDAANNALSAQAVSFTASSGTLASIVGTTAADGKATAVLTAGTDRSNRNIAVTVKSGSITKSITIPVTGTTLTASGSSSLLTGATTNFAVSVKDSGGAAIAASTVAVTSSLGNAITMASTSTDANGAVTFAYAATRSGTDTVTIQSAGAQTQISINVTSVDFAFSAPTANTEVEVNTARTVSVRYASGGAGVAGKVISFSTTRGSVSPSQATTDANGIASTQASAASVGVATISAVVDNGAVTTLPLNFIASTPASLVLQTSSAALPPNVAGSSANQVQLRATVRDAAGNAVKGKTVFFTAVQDLSGGSIKTGSAVTDANGLATDVFISGATSTAANGVQIRATVANTNVTATSSLTISSQALFISIAANNTIEKLNTTYRKTFSVQVNDANGAPVANQNLTLSYWPPYYRKGRLVYSDADNQWIENAGSIISCLNEDANNRNGILDAGEDVNGNGQLTPGLPGVIAPASVTTDAAGSAEFTLTYGQQYAFWVNFELAAKAIVSGTESSSFFAFLASAAASDLTDKTVPPASRLSPFGTATSCSNPN